VFVTMIGGLADGVVHISLLRICEQLDVRVLGYGGSSAGAVLAALAAAGYTADEILAPDAGSPVLQVVGAERPLHLLD
jgi:NTE family protein